MMSIPETKHCEDACLEVKDKNCEDALEMVKDEINRMGIQCYTSEALDQFTSNFSTSCIVGRGGYGVVYQGKFPHTGEQVAIKKLESKDIVEESGTFMAEVRTMSNTNHRNLIKLKGYCFEANVKALVYEFMEKGSLDNFLYKSDTSMKWEKLYRIAVEIANGLRYLHEESNENIIHYDIKAGNVLLDNNFSPKIADFGLAKLIKTDSGGASTSGMRGTQGYAAPELYSPENRSKVTNKCDVYSFGMLLLEILGKRNINVHKQGEYFPEKVWFSFDSGQLELLLDNIPIAEENRKTAIIFAEVALWCIQYLPNKRPTMKEVWLMLDKQKPVVWEPSIPSPFWVPYTSSMTSSMSKYQLSDDDFNGTSSGSNERTIQDASSSLKDYTPGSTVPVQEQTQTIYQPSTIEVGIEGTRKKYYDNGNIYEGTWKNGLREGHGTLWLTDGSRYVGEWKDDLQEGQGEFFWEKGDTYIGEYRNGVEEGHGTFTWANGDEYIGEFKNSFREGQGEMSWKNGNHYIGTYKKSKREGQGICQWTNGDKYTGEYTNGVQEGYGTFIWANGTKYVGEFKNSFKEGQGEMSWKNGNYYEGQFKKSKKEGHGRFVVVNGDEYIGEYRNGVQEGQGRFSYKNGSYHEGTYRNGLKDGPGKFVSVDGEEYCGEWINGVRQ